MAPIVRNTFLAFAAFFSLANSGCESTDGPTPTPAADEAAGKTELPLAIENTPVTITQSPGLASFIEQEDLSALLRDLKAYFVSQNKGDFRETMSYYPLYRTNMDSAQIALSVESMKKFWESGVRNQTEAADVLYVSEMYRDGDQDVVLLNMDLVHRVLFVDYQESMKPEGMKGMVESSYGKGNATFISLDTEPKLEYWEVRGDNRLWAVRQLNTDRWCFLPANFNERGGGAFMTVDAMTALLRHRSSNDPFRLQ